MAEFRYKDNAVQLRLGQAVRALTAALALGSLAPAQAAVYTGQWDPAYGPAFPDLGWKGTATFEIDDSCLLLSGLVSNANACSGNTMKVLGASLVFYDADDPLMTPLETFNFGFDSVVVNGMYVNGGDVTGVNTGYFAPVKPGDGTGPGSALIAGNGDYEFHLTFANDKAQLVYSTPEGQNPLCASPPVPNDPGVECGFAETSPIVTYQAVPEPGSLALVAAALGAGWAVRRRRQRG